MRTDINDAFVEDPFKDGVRIKTLRIVYYTLRRIDCFKKYFIPKYNRWVVYYGSSVEGKDS